MLVGSVVEGPCSSCDAVRLIYDVKSLDPQARFCSPCIRKYGMGTLASAANAALAAREVPKVRTTCLRCGTGLVPGISRGLMCHGCNAAYREVFNRDVKWG